MKAGQKVSKAGQWDMHIVVKFGTVPPKAGRLIPMVVLHVDCTLLSQIIIRNCYALFACSTNHACMTKMMNMLRAALISILVGFFLHANSPELESSLRASTQEISQRAFLL